MRGEDPGEQVMSTFSEIANDLEQQVHRRSVESLKQRVKEAISWGVPDHESIGLQPHQFTSLLAELLRYCEELERGTK